ncbi:Nucleoid occlusion protein [bioreactor metagenome]|uniref:Nucleoid occlusion protein n=1 Tax=bioreactor metagenome TaxID=1076179 RepID=A0A644XMQ0_9ZZZZ
MKSSAKNIQIASYDDLFKTDAERLADTQERIQELPLDKLIPFPNHPFKVNDDEKMQETVDSIKEYGVLVPVLVRPKDDGNYEIVSGHRRHRASILAGKTEIPAIVREMDDDASILVMVDSNLQRETVLPSEKALAYKMKREALNRRGGRPPNNYCQVGNNFSGKTSNEVIADNSPDSSRQIARFIRLTNLEPELLEMVDNKKMAFNSAVEVSYLSQNEQIELKNVLDMNECSPSLSQASRLKKYSQEGKLDANVMDAIMSEEKATESKLVLSGDTIKKYFPKSYTPVEMQKTIIRLLEDWHRKQQRQQER